MNIRIKGQLFYIVFGLRDNFCMNTIIVVFQVKLLISKTPGLESFKISKFKFLKTFVLSLSEYQIQVVS